VGKCKGEGKALEEGEGKRKGKGGKGTEGWRKQTLPQTKIYLYTTGGHLSNCGEGLWKEHVPNRISALRVVAARCAAGGDAAAREITLAVRCGSAWLSSRRAATLGCL